MNKLATTDNSTYIQDGLTVVVIGASGDLAKKKTYPSLFSLYCQNLLPRDTLIWGYARSAKTHSSFRNHIKQHLLKNTGAADDDKTSNELVDSFLSCCYYNRGKSYGDEEAWKRLDCIVTEHEMISPQKSHHNRLFYMATPPNVFGEIAGAIKKYSMQREETGWSRVVIEKPFGRDSQSCKDLLQTISTHFDERHLYRIDHYLGKEVVQNILIWRFGNSIFERIWDRHTVQSVHIIFKENFGTEGRGGYFDNYGIIRDLLQNHLLQILMLVAMEAPAFPADDEGHPPDTTDELIRDTKFKVLESMPNIELEDCLLGQYKGYTDDETITNKDTNCPTYAAVKCHVNTRRWGTVPFVLEAGKALDERLCEVRIQFRQSPVIRAMFPKDHDIPQNELVMRLQPNPAIYLTANIKSPGFGVSPMPIEVGMDYASLPGDNNPDAYTRLLLDVLRGRQGNFLRGDELQRSWEIFTPLLQRIESENIRPLQYDYGAAGPAERDLFLKQKMGVSKPSVMQSAL